MYREVPKQTKQMTFINGKGYYIFAYKRGDVTGDRIPENVFLAGDKPSGEDSPFVDNVTLFIESQNPSQDTSQLLKENAGYNPTLFLGDFTGDKIKDILVSIDSGGSGATTYNYIYTYVKNQLKLIFDFEKFNEQYKYKVVYRDNYKVEVTCLNLKKKYIIDLKYKGKEYLSEIYNKNGKLKQPIEGFVNPMSGFFPIDYQRDGTYELLVMQKIAGRYNADSLGYVQTSLSWNGRDFVPLIQDVAIDGMDIDK